MILEIIQTQCLPQRNCMLTIINDRGETGFLYFKDAQLIEVNVSSKWGQDAFTTIYYWKILRFSVGELPAGIKRTIWDPVEKMIELAAATPPQEITSKNSYLSRFQALPGFVALYEEENGQVYRMAGKDHASIQQMFGFTPNVQEMGKILGAGALKSFYVRTAQFQGWRLFLPQEKKTILVFADAHADSFEAKMGEIL